MGYSNMIRFFPPIKSMDTSGVLLADKAIVMLFSVLRQMKIRKPTCTSQQGEKQIRNLNKTDTDIVNPFK